MDHEIEPFTRHQTVKALVLEKELPKHIVFDSLSIFKNIFQVEIVSTKDRTNGQPKSVIKIAAQAYYTYYAYDMETFILVSMTHHLIGLIWFGMTS